MHFDKKKKTTTNIQTKKPILVRQASFVFSIENDTSILAQELGYIVKQIDRLLVTYMYGLFGFNTNISFALKLRKQPSYVKERSA